MVPIRGRKTGYSKTRLFIKWRLPSMSWPMGESHCTVEVKALAHVGAAADGQPEEEAHAGDLQTAGG
jgi:hypothetical protein